MSLVNRFINKLPLPRRLWGWRYGKFGPGRLPSKKERKDSQYELERLLKNYNA